MGLPSLHKRKKQFAGVQFFGLGVNLQMTRKEPKDFFNQNKFSHMSFTIDDAIIDIEWAAVSGILPPKGRKYRYKVDGVEYITEKDHLTGSEILTNAGKVPPDKFILRERIHGKWHTVELDQTVYFTKDGVEKFKTLPNDQTDGESNAKSHRRDFALLEEDEEFLETIGLVWETVNGENNSQWVLIHGFPIMKGYNVDTALMAINMLPGYPTAQLDMVYFHPALSRTDNQPIPNISPVKIDEKDFQQWSRHRTLENAWRPGVDNLSTHYPLAEQWLLNEFKKRPSRATVPA